MSIARLIPALRRLLAATEGTSLIETALVVPMLAVLVAGLSDTAMGFSKKLKVQQAAARTTEMATAAGLNGAAFQTLQAEAASAAAVPTGQVTLDKWLECGGARQSSFDGTCATGTLPARFVSITISDSYVPMFSAVLSGMRRSSNGKITLSGYSEVRVQ